MKLGPPGDLPRRRAGAIVLLVALAAAACGDEPPARVLLEVFVDDERYRPETLDVTWSWSGGMLTDRVPRQGTLPQTGARVATIAIQIDTSVDEDRTVIVRGMRGETVVAGARVHIAPAGKTTRASVTLGPPVDEATDPRDARPAPVVDAAPPDAALDGADAGAPDTGPVPVDTGPVPDAAVDAVDASGGDTPADAPVADAAAPRDVAPPDTAPPDSSPDATPLPDAAPAMCQGAYGFEASLDGWVAEQCCSNWALGPAAALSTARAACGRGALAFGADFVLNSADRWRGEVHVDVPARAVTTISFSIFFEGPDLPANFTVYAIAQSATSYVVGGTKDVTAGRWNRYTYTFPAARQVNRLGMQIQSAYGAWKGTVYLDDFDAR